MPDNDSGAPPRAVLAAAAVLAVALLGAVGVFGLTTGSRDEPAARDAGPLALVPVPAPQADTPACAALTGALPGELTSSGATLRRRDIAEPAPEGSAAWGGGDGDDTSPVVLRCGVDRPAQLTRTAPLRVVNGVRWLVVTGTGSVSWYAVDRAVYIALTLPEGTGTGVLQGLSDVVGTSLPQVPLRF